MLWRRLVAVCGAGVAAALVGSGGCTSTTTPVEPKPAVLAAHIDTLRVQAFVTADTSKSQQVRAAYSVKLTILTEALFAAAFGVEQGEVSVNAVFASGPWHAMGYELVNTQALADSQF